MPDKMLVWIGASFEDLRDFPPEARRAAGYELRRIQRGSMPTDWKPMPSVGPGVNEISPQTRDTDLTLTRESLKQVEALRREERRRR